MSLQLQGHARSKSALCAQKNRALRGRQEERTPHGIRSSCLPPARPRLCDSCVADADTPFRYALDHCALALEIDEPRRHVIPFRIQRMSAPDVNGMLFFQKSAAPQSRRAAILQAVPIRRAFQPFARAGTKRRRPAHPTLTGAGPGHAAYLRLLPNRLHCPRLATASLVPGP